MLCAPFHAYFTLVVVEGPGQCIATIIDSQYIITASRMITLCPLPLLVLFLVCTVALWHLDVQGQLEACKCGNTKEDDGDEDEKGEEQTSDECGCE